MQKNSVIVTLVHGTWPGSADWMKPSSVLYKALYNKVEGLLAIHSFKWSGKNSHNARLDAARQLVNHHNSILTANPMARHYIISHSHGGNVAMYALSDEKFRSSIAGITTLATPFLHLRHFRNLEGIENLPMWAFWGVMFFAPITLLLIYPIFRHIIGFPMPQWLNRTAIAFNWSIWMEISIWILVTFLIFLIACYGLIKLFVRIGNKIDKSAGIGNDPIQQAPREGLNLLVIRAAGDEANGLLGFLQTLGWLTRMIYGLLAFLVRFWRRLRPSSSRTNNIFGVAGAILFWVLAIFSTPIFMVIITYILGVPFPFVGAAFEFVLINFLFGPFADASVLFRFEWWVLAIWICGIGALVLMTSMIAVIVLSLLLSILAYILRLPFGFFGLLSPLGPLTTELTAEPCPVGDWRVIQLGPQEKTLRYNLWHSEPYSHPGALKVIIAWLNNKKT